MGLRNDPNYIKSLNEKIINMEAEKSLSMYKHAKLKSLKT